MWDLIVSVPDHCLSFYFEPQHNKTNKMTCAPSEDSDQPGHSPSVIRVFAVRSLDELLRTSGFCMRTTNTLTRLGHFVGFVMRRFICVLSPAKC